MADHNMMKMVTLRSSDNIDFHVPEAVASKSQVVRYMIEDDCAQNTIPIHNVDSKTLAKVIDYCTMHVSKSETEAHASKRQKTEEGPSADRELKQWDAEFINVDPDTLYHLINAANYLDIRDLFDLIGRKFAELIRGKSPEKIRMMFNIENDFTPEEEEEIRREHGWAFEENK